MIVSVFSNLLSNTIINNYKFLFSQKSRLCVKMNSYYNIVNYNIV